MADESIPLLLSHNTMAQTDVVTLEDDKISASPKHASTTADSELSSEEVAEHSKVPWWSYIWVSLKCFRDCILLPTNTLSVGLRA